VRPAPIGKPGYNGTSGDGPAVRPEPAGPPALSIAAGRPSAEEIAAVVVAVLAARAGPASRAGVAGQTRNQWSSRSRLLREPLPRGPGGWRASALPR